MDAKRSKPTKWSSEEKRALINLINCKKEILLDGVGTSSEKSAAWQEIFEDMKNKFGAKFSQKDVKKIKLKWRRIKEAAQQNLTSYNMRMTQSISDETRQVCNLFDINMNSSNIQWDELTKRRQTVFKNIRKNVSHFAEVKIKEEIIDEPQEIVEKEHFYDICSDHDYTNDCDKAEEIKNVDEETVEDINENLEHENKNNTQNEEVSTCSNNVETESVSVEDMKKGILVKEYAAIDAIRETAEIQKIIAIQKLKILMKTKEGSAGLR